MFVGPCNVMRCVGLIVALVVAGCTAGTNLGAPVVTGSTVGVSAPAEKSDLKIAHASFKRGAYGLSEKHYRLAIQRDRNNAEAWLGLAASYDQLRRYDLADRAYDRLKSLLGDSAVVLNNQGYSRILRGDYDRADALLRRARRKAPNDSRIHSNIALLERKRSEAGR